MQACSMQCPIVEFSTKESEKINILLVNPKKCWKQIKLNKKTKVESLIRAAFNDNEKYICIFKGSVVNLDFTVDKIGIKNNEILFAVKSENEKNIDHRWLKLSIDPNFEQKIQILSNNLIKKEYNRLCDVRNLKIESNIKLYKNKLIDFI